MRFTDDVARGDWIAARLDGWGTVRSTVGGGWEAYARILHRPDLRRIISRTPPEYEDVPVTWRDIAERRGIAWHPAVQWAEIIAAGSYLDTALQIGDPAIGNVGAADLAEFARIAARHTPSTLHATAAFWHGHAELHPGADTSLMVAVLSPRDIRRARRRARQEMTASVAPDIARAADRGPLLALPGRGYVLLECAVEEFADDNWGATAGVGWRWGNGPTPNLLWPADRSWLMAGEIDYDSTIIGGSRQLIDDLLASPLETVEVAADTDLALTR